jgi:hypothetical protein
VTRNVSRLTRKRTAQERRRTRAAKLTAMNEYQQARIMERHFLRKKKEQLDDQALIEIEQYHSVQDSSKFYNIP